MRWGRFLKSSEPELHICCLIFYHNELNALYLDSCLFGSSEWELAESSQAGPKARSA